MTTPTTGHRARRTPRHSPLAELMASNQHRLITEYAKLRGFPTVASVRRKLAIEGVDFPGLGHGVACIKGASPSQLSAVRMELGIPYEDFFRDDFQTDTVQLAAEPEMDPVEKRRLEDDLASLVGEHAMSGLMVVLADNAHRRELQRHQEILTRIEDVCDQLRVDIPQQVQDYERDEE